MTIKEYAERLDKFLSQFPSYLDTPEGKEGIRQLQENMIRKYLSMYKYKFKAKDLKTGEWVEGDLVYANVVNFKTGISIKKKPIIVTMYIHGGILWAGNRHFVDESTIELIKEEW